ncbi:lysoplasmalogenase family protein [Rhodococcus sp. IEGM 1408]|uniref:lysoplasmalogenase family protein n=1 Tax=Rhodococcus sp. IEGM 1408 TaxID=3082220 RepID=UPI002953D4A3|nr:lysoplasmalogenase family protein [Rhodococcus sp. IEGM 1408]MDV8001679.1 lysoplasmalogenase family protein [Rhodococcus sp. IEGM 1408]
MRTTSTTTTRTFPTGLTQALKERVLALTDVARPEGPAFLAAAAGTEVAKAVDFGALEKLCKPLIVPAALAIALRDGGLREGRLSPVDTALLAATGAAYTTGDVILMLGEGHAGRSSTRLVSGAAAFGVGHLALGGLMLRSGLRFKPLQVALHGVIAGSAGAVLLAEDRSNAPLAAYGGLLAALSALATSVDRRNGPAASVLAVAGPVFLLSDALILVRRKTEGGSVLARALDVGVIDTYATAALLLLTGTAAAARTAGRVS